ncbi:SH3 domain-containing protein [Candidatus Latescibacterota bacterium]
MNRQCKVILSVMLVMMVLVSSAWAEFYNRAPDVLPGTLPEMRNPSYWINRAKNSDEVVMSVDEIHRMNEAYRKWVQSPDPFKGVSEERMPELTYWWPGIVMMVPDLHKLDSRAVADTLRKRIGDEIEYLRSREFGNPLAVRYSDREIDGFEKEMALDRVKDTLSIRDGIAVRTTRLRNVPSFYPIEPGLWENAKTRWELWTVAVLKTGKPVTVLHRSRTGEHVFVLCEVGYGWVSAEDIAFGRAEQIENFVNPEHFVVCTGDRVPFYSDKSCMYASGFFRMGDRLPIDSQREPRKVNVPVRKVTGEFTTETAWLTENADVHVGWLPYTRRNIILTAFKLLDNTYDWTGAWFGRQHETTYRDIFACFGFDLPYHGALFSFYGDDDTVIDPSVGKEEQYRIILQHEPFLTLQGVGTHFQLLIGEYNGEPIVFDQHGYGYSDEDGTELEVRRCCVGDLRMPSYFLKRKIVFLELK